MLEAMLEAFLQRAEAHSGIRIYRQNTLRQRPTKAGDGKSFVLLETYETCGYFSVDRPECGKGRRSQPN